MTKKLYEISKIHKDTYLIGTSVGDSSHESISIYAHMILQTHNGLGYIPAQVEEFTHMAKGYLAYFFAFS